MKRVRRHLFALFTTAIGSGGVFGLVYAMNAASGLPEQTVRQEETSFEVERKPPPPKPKRERVEKKKQTSTPRASAPTPNLTSTLSGVSFDLPQFESADFSGTTDKLLGTTSREQIFTTDAVDEKPRALTQRSPEYPPKARQRGITGFVRVNLLINTSGEVEKVKVLEAQPQGIFEESALASVQNWRFEPPRYQGEPVKMWFQQTVRFNLN